MTKAEFGFDPMNTTDQEEILRTEVSGKLSVGQRLAAAWRRVFTPQGRLDAKAMLRGELSQDSSDVMKKLPPLE